MPICTFFVVRLAVDHIHQPQKIAILPRICHQPSAVVYLSGIRHMDIQFGS
jgi:hypothetical protein